MKTRILTVTIIALLVLPFSAKAIDQTTLDQMLLLLYQPESTGWSDGIYDDATLIEGLGQIYNQAVSDEDFKIVRRSLWAMGETGLTAFVPTLIDAIDDEPDTVAFALSKISSSDGVYALIDLLGDEDEFIRDVAATGLGDMPYISGMEDAMSDAYIALQAALEVETESWVRDEISDSIVKLQNGVSTDTASD